MTNNSWLDENKAAARKIVHLFSSGDLSDVSSLISPEYVDQQWIQGITLRGPEGFSQLVTFARNALPHLTVVIHDIIAEGENVVVRLHWHSRSFLGRTIDRETIDILRFAQGQQVAYWGAEVWPPEPCEFWIGH
jgi:predicted ester cyclase